MSTAHGPAPEVSDPVADILRAAYYYALFDGHAEIDPALVLVAAARNDKTLARPMLGAALAEALPRLAADVPAGAARQAGEAGPLLAANVSADAAGQAEEAEPAATRVPALREARWVVLRGNDEKLRAQGATGAGPALPLWDREVAEALERAADEAASAGAPQLGVAALLLGLLRSEHPAVHSLAGTAGLDIAATTSALREQCPWAPEEPYTPLTGLLAPAGITDQRIPLLIRWVPGVIRRFTTRHERLGPVLIVLELEILRQTVITGHRSVQEAHLLLAIMSMREQLTAIGSGLAARYRQRNQGDLILTRKGFDLRSAQLAAERLPPDDDVLTPADLLRRHVSTGGKIGDPSWTRPAAMAMEHAGDLARRHHHRDIGTTHLLAATLKDADSTASLLLGSLGIDAASLRDDLDQQLGTPP
jgi:hypothetical protein